MGNLRTPDRVTSPTNGTNGTAYATGNGTDAMAAFYTEVRALKQNVLPSRSLGTTRFVVNVALRSLLYKMPSPRTMRTCPALPTFTIAA